MARENKKILLVIPNLGQGGAQRVFHQQLNYYSKHFEVIGCVFNWEGALGEDKIPTIYSLGVPGGDNIAQKIYYFFIRIWRLRKLKQAHRVDVAISHLEGADYVNILSAAASRVYCWVHGTKINDREIKGYLGWLRLHIILPVLYRRADMLIAVSKGISSELKNRFKLASRKVVTIPNCFDSEEIILRAAARPKWDLRMLAPSASIFLTHCRLARQKNLFPLLNIYSIVSQKKNAKLFILGDGDQRDALYVHSIGLGLKTFASWKETALHDEDWDVYFLGYCENPYPMISMATLYLLTSAWEGFPLALCEAMACGIPVMSSDCFTGPREIIAPSLATEQPVLNPYESEEGILMPVPDSQYTIEIWAQAVCKLLDNEEKRKNIGQRGSRRILDFDYKRISKKWLEIIHE
jgi:glycosyltransferase involved in cell wall biosynthesis